MTKENAIAYARKFHIGERVGGFISSNNQPWSRELTGVGIHEYRDADGIPSGDYLPVGTWVKQDPLTNQPVIVVYDLTQALKPVFIPLDQV